MPPEYHQPYQSSTPKSSTSNQNASTGAYYGAYSTPASTANNGVQPYADAANAALDLSGANPSAFQTSPSAYPLYASMQPPPPQQQQHPQTLPPPILPLSGAISTNAGTPQIPRSMSMGSIPGHLGSSYPLAAPPHSFSPANLPSQSFTGSGRNTPSGALTPHSSSGLYSITRPSRLGMPSLTIPSSSTPMHLESSTGGPNQQGQQHQQQAHEPSALQEHMYGGSAGVSPSTPGAPVLSSMVSLRGTGSGPGTASNGGSVPLTPTADDTVSFDPSYSQITTRLSRLSHHHSGGGGVGDPEGIEENDEEDAPMLSISTSRLFSSSGGGSGSAGSSPRRSTAGGVTRTEKKRRSFALAAGPAQAGNRSRSGTLVGSGSGGLVPLTTIAATNGSLATSPIDALSATAAFGDASTSSSVVGSSTSLNGSMLSNGVGVGGQTNSPLAMKELSPSVKPVIEEYLLRYLNHLCMNRTCFAFFPLPCPVLSSPFLPSLPSLPSSLPHGLRLTRRSSRVLRIAPFDTARIHFVPQLITSRTPISSAETPNAEPGWFVPFHSPVVNGNTIDPLSDRSPMECVPWPFSYRVD